MTRKRLPIELSALCLIVIALLLAAMSAAGNGSTARYEQVRPSKSGDYKTAFRFKVRQSTIVGFGVVVPLHYRNEPLALLGTGKLTRADIAINGRSMRFRRVVRGGGVETLQGRLIGGKIVGRYSFVTKNGHSGKSFADPWVGFRASRVE